MKDKKHIINFWRKFTSQRNKVVNDVIKPNPVVHTLHLFGFSPTGLTAREFCACLRKKVVALFGVKQVSVKTFEAYAYSRFLNFG